jgi:hypothetical protein
MNPTPKLRSFNVTSPLIYLGPKYIYGNGFQAFLITLLQVMSNGLGIKALLPYTLVMSASLVIPILSGCGQSMLDDWDKLTTK